MSVDEQACNRCSRGCKDRCVHARQRSGGATPRVVQTTKKHEVMRAPATHVLDDTSSTRHCS
eukprot:2504820-Pleurochrysis_carterae.AAC.2